MLRFLQEGRVTRIGGNQVRQADARVISATHRDLVAMVEGGTFRRDLFYRLNVVQIDLPPLRERRGDIPLLMAYFVERFCRGAGIPSKIIAPESLTLLVAHSWPGNVRELANVVERACTLTPGRVITPESLPSYFLSSMVSSDHGGASNIRSLAELERQHIVEVLAQAQWNITQAARVLEVHRSTLYRKIWALNLPNHTQKYQ